jgi:hypothetical protein
MAYTVLILYLVALIVIGFLIHLAVKTPTRISRDNIPPPASFETHWWGYGWRPWWRKYSGLPGMADGKPLPEPKMPVVPQSYIIPNRPRVI